MIKLSRNKVVQEIIKIFNLSRCKKTKGYFSKLQLTELLLKVKLNKCICKYNGVINAKKERSTRRENRT